MIIYEIKTKTMNMKCSNIDSNNKYNIFPFQSKDEYISKLFENYILRGNKPLTLNNSGKETDLLFYYNFLETADFHKDKDGYDTVQLYLIRDCRLVPIKMKLPE